MSIQKSKEIIRTIADEIRRGEHGASGSPFMTVLQLCEEFNVSPVTAQRIVNQLKIQGLLIRSGKRLNIADRQMNTVAPCRIGVLVTNIDNPFFSRLLNAIELAGRRNEVEIISAGSNYDPAYEEKQLEMLSNGGANGFLICPAHAEKSAKVLSKLEQPFVLIGRRIENLEADTIMVNDFEAGRMAATHLIEQNCHDFLYVGLRDFTNDMRFAGFSFELHEHKIEFPPSHHLHVDPTCGTAHHELHEHLRNCYRERKTGVFCYHDLLAMRMLRAARLCQLRIPGELSLIGMDDLPLAAEAYPSLTSISYPIRQIAEGALELLLRRLTTQTASPGAVTYLDPTLVIRESSFEIPKAVNI